MGQKTNPIGNRLGLIRTWDSVWYGGKDYGSKILEDHKIRAYLKLRLAKCSVAKVHIRRKNKYIDIIIDTARPGLIIGKGGQEVEKLKLEIKKVIKKEVQVYINEIKRPELIASLVAENITRQIEARVNYKRAIKMAISSSMRLGVQGIKVKISGRLNGAEMARSELFKEGRTPLHTFRSDIDYFLSEAQTTYGKLGVKVWICRGEKYGKQDLYRELDKFNSK
ncbi:MAG: 30S ribosomal protein S3 [Flavobacteriales bacterium]|nr:30S ribosomal protein S3 [Flavobacteriales bacterium]